MSLAIGSVKEGMLPFTNNIPDRSLNISVESEHDSICEVIIPRKSRPMRLDPYDTCRIRLRFKAMFSQAFDAHCDITIKDVTSGRLIERIRFDISVHN